MKVAFIALFTNIILEKVVEHVHEVEAKDLPILFEKFHYKSIGSRSFYCVLEETLNSLRLHNP